MSLIEKLLQSLNVQSSVAATILSVAVILFLGFLVTRVTKLLKLPNVTAYILTGIVLVPVWRLSSNSPINGVIPQDIIDGMDFLTDIALAFIAFSAGQFFKVSELKRSGLRVVAITLLESVTAAILVFVLCRFIFGIDFAFSLVLAALSSATAPASTLMTIRQTNSKGDYVNTLLQVVALDDVVALLLYSVAISVCLAISNGAGTFSFSAIGLPLLKSLLCITIGGAFGFILVALIPKRSTDNKLIIAVAILFFFCGVCVLFDQSPLLGCMAMGMVYTNKASDEKLFKQLNYFSPPIMLCFFVMSGMRFDLNALFSSESVGFVPLLIVAILYFVIRIIGKYSGAYFGCLITRKDKKVRNYLGLALIPQAGVAIGLAAMGARILGGDYGRYLQAIILASSVLYELIGPACAKLGLYLSGSYSMETLAPSQEIIVKDSNLSPVEILTEQIKKIQSDNKKTVQVVEEDETAFNEAAEEYYEYSDRNRRFINRR